MATWKDDIIQSLKDLGGQGHLSDIYSKVKARRRKPLPDTWEDMIRGVIETHSSDSLAYNKRQDLFKKIGRKGDGIWALRAFTPPQREITPPTTISPQRNPADVLEFPEWNDDSLEGANEFPEGADKFKLHKMKERNPQLIIEAKKQFKNKYGNLSCEVCDFDFEKMYGELGSDFIEAHHIKPISEIKEGEKTKLNDIVMVCSNCHRMLHKKRPWITHGKLKDLLNKK